MKVIKRSLIAIVVMLIGIVLGFLLLVAVFLLPTQRMTQNLAESREALVQVNGTGEMVFGYSSTYVGIYTDCLMLQEAIYRGEHSVLEAAMGIYRFNIAEDQWYPRDALVMYLDGVPGVETDYARYWHGYLIFLKPLLMLFNWGELQFFGTMLQLFLTGLVLYRLFQRKLTKYAVAFGIALLFLCPMIMPVSLSLSICFYLTMTVMLIQLLMHEKIYEKQYYCYFFIIVGMATSYFDFLTYPIITLGIPLTLYLILQPEEGLGERIRRVIWYPMMWGVGYIGMWAAKWGIGSWILQKNILADASETLAQRTAPVFSDSRVMSTLQVIKANLREYVPLPYRLVVIGLVVGVVLCIVLYPGTKTKVWKFRNCIPFAIVALFPFAWYAVALNHSGEHYMFTFRALTVTVFAGSSMLMGLFDWGKKRQVRKS